MSERGPKKTEQMKLNELVETLPCKNHDCGLEELRCMTKIAEYIAADRSSLIKQVEQRKAMLNNSPEVNRIELLSCDWFLKILKSESSLVE
jgi:hypothetical protein